MVFLETYHILESKTIIITTHITMTDTIIGIIINMIRGTGMNYSADEPEYGDISGVKQILFVGYATMC